MNKDSYGKLAKYIKPLYYDPFQSILEKSEEHNLNGLDHWKVKNDYLKATACFTKAHNLNPNEPSYLWHRAEAHLALGHFHASEADYLNTLNLLPKNATTHRLGFIIEIRLGLLYLTLAQLMVDANLNAFAQRYISLATKFHVPRTSIQVPVMLMQVCAGQYEEALDSITTLLPESKKPSDLLILAARINCELDRYDQVNSLLKQLQKMAPFHSELHKLNGYLVKCAIQFKTAADSIFTKQLCHKPQTFKESFTFAVPLLAALPYYAKALELDPSDSIACMNRGLVYLWTHQYENALRDFFSCMDSQTRPGTSQALDPRPESSKDKTEERPTFQQLFDILGPAKIDYELIAATLRTQKFSELERVLSVTNWRHAQYLMQTTKNCSTSVLVTAMELLDTSLLFDATNGFIHLEKAQWCLLVDSLNAPSKNSDFVPHVAPTVYEELLKCLASIRVALLNQQDAALTWWYTEAPVTEKGPASAPIFCLPSSGVPENYEVATAALAASCAYLEGYRHFSAGDFEAATVDLETSIRLFPTSVALMLLANCLTKDAGATEKRKNLLLASFYLDETNAALTRQLSELGIGKDNCHQKCTDCFNSLLTQGNWTPSALDFLKTNKINIQPLAFITNYQMQLLKEWQIITEALGTLPLDKLKVPIESKFQQVASVNKIAGSDDYIVKPLPKTNPTTQFQRQKQYQESIRNSEVKSMTIL